MWVRYKDYLANANQFQINKGIDDRFMIMADDAAIGIYDTHDRAVEVLNAIQKKVRRNVVFIMPEK